ncbi:MAG: penicillin-binding protein 1C [Deltaproteobacteria bacterium]|nr:penicillin-binding protein 1C [Deltaproteobacteria bacterium]
MRRILFPGVCVVVVAVHAAAWCWPPPAALGALPVSTRVLARDGAVLHETPGPGGQRGRGRAGANRHLVAATLAGEDHRFFQHGGLDGLALVRAVWLDAQRGRWAFGGSTLTQQLARLLEPGPRTVARKLRQAFTALVLEAHLSKAEILDEYLARASYGGDLVGASAAAAAYLGKDVSQLSLGEAALLAVIPRAPRRYDPRRHLDEALRRRDRVLSLLVQRGEVTAAEADAARAEPVRILPAAPPFLAPHAVVRILAAAPAGDVRSTLDAALQDRAQQLVARTVRELSARGVTQAAALVAELPGGDVRAYVGSADFFDETASGQVDALASPRSPGSVLKPVFYAWAMDRAGFTPATVLHDVDRAFPDPGGAFLPRNFDGRAHGPVTLRDALGNSYNLAAVDLAARLGVPALREALAAFGLHPVQADRPEGLGLGMVLGGMDVTPWDVARAFAVLARGGRAGALRLVQESTPGAAERVVSPATAALVTDILRDDGARSRAFGRHSALQLPFDAAVKTGTSKDFRDNWAVGYSSRYVVAAWAGDFHGRPMSGVSGITGAGRLWHRLMRAVHADADPPPLEPAVALDHAAVCTLSGARAGPHCPSSRRERFAPGTAPAAVCSWHGPGGTRTLPAELASWALAAPTPVRLTSDRVRVLFPPDGGDLALDGTPQSGTVLLAAAPADEEVRLVLDGREVARGRGHARSLWRATEGAHVLEAVGPSGRDRRVFTVRP